MKRSHNLPAITLRPRRRRLPPVRVRIKSIKGDVVSFGSPGPKDETWRKQLQAAFGSVSDDFLDTALRYLTFAACLPGQGPTEPLLNTAVSIVAAAAPKNELEAAVVLQAVSAHVTAMAMMARIGLVYGGPQYLPDLASTAAKLIRACSSSIDTLRRLRSGGEQKIIVQHVTVHDGGRAIVGSVNPRASEVER
jgi:hypothetical protein